MNIRRDRPGNWTVSVQRRWYRPVTVWGIRVKENECGPVRPTPITIQLKPTSDAPYICEFPIFPALPDGLLVGFWPYYRRYVTVLDAPSIANRTVIWLSSNPGVATIDQTGMLRSVRSRLP